LFINYNNYDDSNVKSCGWTCDCFVLQQQQFLKNLQNQNLILAETETTGTLLARWLLPDKVVDGLKDLFLSFSRFSRDS
jgi:hypothetical protein